MRFGYPRGVSKPQLGSQIYGNNFACGLQIAALLNEYGTAGPIVLTASPVFKAFNLLNRHHGLGTGTIGPSAPQNNWANAIQGRGFINNSASLGGAIDFGAINIYPSFANGISIVLLAAWDPAIGGFNERILNSGNGGSLNIVLQMNHTTAHWEGGIIASGTSAGVTFGVPKFPSNINWMDFIAYTYDGVTARGYLNGINTVNSVINKAIVFPDATQTIQLGGTSLVNNENSRAPIGLFCLWNRVLSYAEIQQLYQDPHFSLVAPPLNWRSKRIFVAGSVAPPSPPTGTNRFGVNTFLQPQPANQIPYRLCVNNNRLHCVLPDFTGIFSDFVYYLGRENNQGGYWYRYVIDPSAMFSEEDGTLFAGFGDGGVGNLFTLDTANVLNFAGTDIKIDVIFPFSKNEINQRKDVYHLRLHIDTGNSPLDLTGYTEFSPSTAFSLGKIQTSGIKEVNLLIQNTQFNLARRMALRINGAASFFKLIDWSLDYDARPEPLSFLRIATNYGLASKKRIRTIPIVIDTRGNNVTINAVLDGISYGNQTFNTTERTTVYYYFNTDVFPTDIIINITALNGNVFEYYEAPTPVNVEVLPVAKLFDQIGPVELERIGALLEFRVRMVATTNLITYNVYMDDNSVVTSQTFATTPNVDKTYGPIKMPKGIQGSVCRIEFLATAPFYRWNCKMKFTTGGIKSDTKQVTIQDKSVGLQS